MQLSSRTYRPNFVLQMTGIQTPQKNYKLLRQNCTEHRLFIYGSKIGTKLDWKL